MRDNPLISILIPTFNRNQYLHRLLAQLQRETVNLETSVRVIIINNNSSDETESTVQDFLADNSHFSSIKQTTNIGPDRNFLAAVACCKTPYFWMIGDDDLPRTGLIRLLVEFLRQNKPTLVYLPSQWSPSIDASDLPKLESFSAETLGPTEFARSINVYTTFISAWIVNINSLREQGIGNTELSRGIGTSFVQLGWILPLIKKSSTLTRLNEPGVLATGGNTGGYQVLTTFCVSYPKCVRREFPNNKEMQHALLAPFARTYLPDLICSFKSGSFNKMLPESGVLVKATINLGQYKEFWTHTLPALIQMTSPRPKPPHREANLIARALRSARRRSREKVAMIYSIVARRLAFYIAAEIELMSKEQGSRKMQEHIDRLKQVGEGLELPTDADIIGHQFLAIGSNFAATRGLRLHCWQSQTFEGISSPSLTIGDRVFFNREAYVSCANSITIGSDSLFGSNVLITDNYHGCTKVVDMSRLKSPLSCPATITIEDGVWVGNNVCILPGSHIGKGSIIGANSVVNSRIPPFSIAAGAPARVIKTLNPQELDSLTADSASQSPSRL